eukprot:CAMPEP_0171928680 /NCGR_PEP_ID=MMETSP0993-20121228/26944_1 /TAXON_ID=483369 /ORGANISM="non described non described, Strain CCMP2098" /LENGTH=180 /DNA_ID=CAMNT_0012568019 /DNA_START=161 /DNA_END=699 /DNA_ORIENTATION=+
MPEYNSKALQLDELRNNGADSIVPGWVSQALGNWYPKNQKPQLKHLHAALDRRGYKGIKPRTQQECVNILAALPVNSDEAASITVTMGISANGETTSTHTASPVKGTKPREDDYNSQEESSGDEYAPRPSSSTPSSSSPSSSSAPKSNAPPPSSSAPSSSSPSSSSGPTSSAPKSNAPPP